MLAEGSVAEENDGVIVDVFLGHGTTAAGTAVVVARTDICAVAERVRGE